MSYSIPETGTEVMVDGRYFESITEGQWYSYFKSVGMEPECQPSTFLLGQSVVYTPDFYLPKQETYVEVKNGNVTQESINRAQSLARQVGRAVLFINGRPKNPTTRLALIGPDHQTDQPTNSDHPPTHSMRTLQNAAFFDGRQFPFSRRIDQTVKRQTLASRDRMRREAHSSVISMTAGEAQSMLAEIERMISRPNH